MFSESPAWNFFRASYAYGGGCVLLLLGVPQGPAQVTFGISSGEMHEDKCSGNVGGCKKSLPLAALVNATGGSLLAGKLLFICQNPP